MHRLSFRNTDRSRERIGGCQSIGLMCEVILKVSDKVSKGFLIKAGRTLKFCRQIRVQHDFLLLLLFFCFCFVFVLFCFVFFCYVACGKPSRKFGRISPFLFYFLLGRKSEKLRNKVFPVTPLLSSVFVPRVFCAYLW